MKKFFVLFLIVALCILCFAACDKTPSTDGTTPDTGETPGTGDTPGTPDTGKPDGTDQPSTPEPDKGTEETWPKKLDTLAGKTAEELYLGIGEYIALLQNFTLTGNMADTYYYDDGTEYADVGEVYVKYATSAFDMGVSAEIDGEMLTAMRVVYDGVYVYVDMDGTLMKAKMSYEEFKETFGEDMFASAADEVDVDIFSETAIYETEDGHYYIEMTVDVDALEEEELASLLPEGGVLESYVYRAELDATGKFLSEETCIESTQMDGWEMVTCESVYTATLTGVGTTRVSAPDNADDYMDAGEMPEEPEPDYNAKFTVIFMYVDPMGDPMADVYGYTQRTVKNVPYGEMAWDELMDDPQAFVDYVIIGWDADFDGIPDYDYEYVTEDLVLYSIVRPKEQYEVTLLRSDGTFYDSVTVTEGAQLDPSHLKAPVELGKYFKGWEPVDPYSPSTLDCIMEDCSFIARVGSADGTIGKVASDTILLDGVRDDAYTVSGAYLAFNKYRQADQEITASYDVNTVNPNTGNMGNRAVPTVDVDTWIVWDGDYIYVCIEVSDKTLVGRSRAYAKGGIDAYLNDAIELRYCFEQDYTLKANHTRVGLDAFGTATYALPRSLGIGEGRSTHYDDIRYAVRTALTAIGSDLSPTGYVDGVSWDKASGAAEPESCPSYIVELAIPAWTEGVAADIRGVDKKTGRIPGASLDSNAPEDYAFTTGDQLVAGDLVRFSLQVNDLSLTREQMTGATGTYFWDTPPMSNVLADWPAYDPAKHTSMLFATDGEGRITGEASIYGIFSAAGNTQRDLSQYVWFSLGSDGTAETKIWSMTTEGWRNTSVFLDEHGQKYVRS